MNRTIKIHIHYFFSLLVFLFFLTGSLSVSAASTAELKEKQRKLCEDPITKEVKAPFDCRVMYEKEISQQPFVMIPYRPSYILASWDSSLKEQDANNETYETKFQFSFKVPLWRITEEWIAYFGYTQISVWQMLNEEHSSPFRDTNFEPELMLYYLPKGGMFGGTLRLVNIGLLNHQSNGRSGEFSRSWNRYYLQTVFEFGRHNYLSLTAWKRDPEKKKSNPSDPIGDDNEDIEKFVGDGEIKYHYIGEIYNFAVTARENFYQGNYDYGSYQLDFTMPTSLFRKKGLRIYFQYFNGYGETLIDYNKKRERFGMGVILADWL